MTRKTQEMLEKRTDVNVVLDDALWCLSNIMPGEYVVHWQKKKKEFSDTRTTTRQEQWSITPDLKPEGLQTDRI